MTGGIDMTEKKYKAKANKIAILCFGIPAVAAVAVLPFIYEAGAWTAFWFEFVYVGVPAYILSKVYESAMNKLDRLIDM